MSTVIYMTMNAHKVDLIKSNHIARNGSSKALPLVPGMPGFHGLLRVRPRLLDCDTGSIRYGILKSIFKNLYPINMFWFICSSQPHIIIARRVSIIYSQVRSKLLERYHLLESTAMFSCEFNNRVKQR